MNSQKHPVVVITGASAGVGRAAALEFARNGAKVALLARGKDGLDGAKKEIKEKTGREALAISVDVADAEKIEAAATQVESELGPIDIWVNNAMVSVFSPVREMKPEEYRRVTEVTYLGAVYGTLAALKRMQERNSGSIVQVGSALAYRSIPLQSAYCAAKHALLGFTESLRTELLCEKSSIKLTMVHLPALNTPQFNWVKSRLPHRAQPVPPIFQPELAARAIVHASSHNKREWYVGFPTAKAIWADKWMPSLADRYLARNGFDSQQTEEEENPRRPHNLWEPVPGDHGAHGRFDEQAKNTSWQYELVRWKPWIAGAAGLAFLAVAQKFRKSA